MLEQYYKVSQPVETMIVEKKSKFICNLIPCETEEAVESALQLIRKQHYGARHNCYAYRLIVNNDVMEKSSDDGEPSGTAGKPMLEVLKGQGLCNTLAVVTRYFGGTLLGTGGLLKAYTESTQEACGASKTACYQLLKQVGVTVDYGYGPKLEHAIRSQEYRMMDAIYTDRVTYRLLLPLDQVDRIHEQMTEMTNGSMIWEAGENGFVPV